MISQGLWLILATLTARVIASGWPTKITRKQKKTIEKFFFDLTGRNISQIDPATLRAHLGVGGKRFRMVKGMTIMAMAVAVLIFLLFALDLALGFPFSRASLLMDITFVVCAILLGYIGWSSFKELR